MTNTELLESTDDESGPDGSGWVCLHRRILASPVFVDPELLRLWLWCLLKASHRDRWVPFKSGKGTRQVSLKTGQFIYGRNSAAETLGTPSTTTDERMQKLERLGCIAMHRDKQFSIVTVCNWQIYQDGNSQFRQAPGRQPTATRQATGTNNNANHSNNTNSSRRALRFDPADLDFAEQMLGKIRVRLPKFKQPNLDVWANDIRLAREQDGRTLPELREVFNFADGDLFWQRNILCPTKLREKFDTLTANLKSPANAKHQPPSPARPRSGEYSDPKKYATSAAST